MGILNEAHGLSTESRDIIICPYCTAENVEFEHDYMDDDSRKAICCACGNNFKLVYKLCYSTYKLQEKEALKVGDKVVMKSCLEAEKYGDRVWEVGCNPWNLCGSEVVLLLGRSGGFDVSCLKRVDVDAGEN
jgi:hypothetical protein